MKIDFYLFIFLKPFETHDKRKQQNGKSTMVGEKKKEKRKREMWARGKEEITQNTYIQLLIEGKWFLHLRTI